MSRFYGSVSKSQNGKNQFVWVIDTSISDRLTLKLLLKEITFLITHGPMQLNV